MVDSIDIPCTVGRNLIDKDQQIKVTIDLIEFLGTYSSSYKITGLSTELKNELISDIDTIKNLHKGKLKEVINILRCLQCKVSDTSIILSCNHGFCNNCISDYIRNSTNQLIISNEAEESRHVSPACPKCSQNIIEEDLISLCGDLTHHKDQATLRKIQSDLDSENSFQCFTCGVRRGPHQFMKNTCQHMCKSCFSVRITEGFEKTCTHCGQEIAYQEYKNDQMTCKSCTRTFYLIGDFMQEICLNCFYCVDCSENLITDGGICKCHNTQINFIKKREILSAIIRTCSVCNEEKGITSFLRLKCCKTSICFYCSNSIINCRNCNTRFDQVAFQKIQEFFSQSRN